MRRYLLFDSGCITCSQIAKFIKEESEGELEVRSLLDEHIQQMFLENGIPQRWEPTLIEAGCETVKAVTGLKLQLALLRLLGFRRALNIVQAIFRQRDTNHSGAPYDKLRRRSLLRGTAFAFASILLGLHKLPRAQSKTPVFSSPQIGRQEGFMSYEIIQKSGNQATIKFTHVEPDRSEIIEISKPSEEVTRLKLSRKEKTLLLGFHHADGTVVLQDRDNSKAVSHVINEKRVYSDEINKLINTHHADIILMGAISVDYRIYKDSTNRSKYNSGAASSDISSCPCGSYSVRGQGYDLFQSHACHKATLDTHAKCSNQWCWGCCTLLDCDCSCFPPDYPYFCACFRSGARCSGPCS